MAAMMTVEMVEANIMVIDNAFDWGACLVKTAEELNLWTPAPTAGPTTDWRVSDIAVLSKLVHPGFGEFEDLFKPVVKLVYDAWIDENPWAIYGAGGRLVNQDTGYGLLRYGVGGYYKPHIDNGPYTEPSIARRQVSIVAYPADDFDGGELDFPRQRVRITPKPGMVVSFPASPAYPHASLPVTWGTKYAISTWIF